MEENQKLKTENNKLYDAIHMLFESEISCYMPTDKYNEIIGKLNDAQLEPTYETEVERLNQRLKVFNKALDLATKKLTSLSEKYHFTTPADVESWLSVAEDLLEGGKRHVYGGVYSAHKGAVPTGY